jgi:hypothetical protein
MSCLTLHAQTPLRRLLREANVKASSSHILPAFLVPSVYASSSNPSHIRRRPESTFAAAPAEKPDRIPKSRIGRAPITIPSEVSLRFYDLPKSTVRSRHPDTASVAVDITGPLGT